MGMRRYADATTFEEAYARAPFSEMIRLALMAAAALRRFRDGTGNGHELTGATPASAS